MTLSGRVTFRRISRLLPLIPLIVLCASCSDFWVSNSSTQTIKLSPTALILKLPQPTANPPVLGDSAQISASATTVGGATTDETTAATWTSSNAGVATVGSNTGLVTAVGTTTGTSVITATFGGQSATANVLTYTGITPGSIIINFPGNLANPVPAGTTFQVTAFATLNGTSTDISKYVTWTITPNTAATIDANGNVTVLSNAGALGLPTTVTINAAATFGSATASGSTTFSAI